MSGFSVLTLLLVSRMVMSTCGQDYSDQYDVASVIDPGDLPVLSENVVQTEPRQQQEVLPLLTQDSEVGAVVAAEDMCRVSTGESNIVLDLEESRGTDYSQKTRPRELPILGEVGRDINLELVFPTGYTIFTLQDKSLHLTEPLDRDESDLSSIVFQVTCTVLSSRKRRTIPIIVRVTDLNDNSPQFLGTPYTLTLEENTPVNTTVFTELKAVDDDSGRNSQIEYNVVRGDGSENDGFGYFAINFPHQGFITIARPLDFEATKTYYVNIKATDKAQVESQRRSSLTLVTVNVLDSDDQDPVFLHQLYTSRVTSGVVTGVLDIKPDTIHAQDQDSLRSEISYSFLSGNPSSFKDYFSIDSKTGVVRQIREVDRETVGEFEMVLQAEEKTERRRRAQSKILIKVEAKDIHPPVLTVTANEGFVDENSAVGSQVLDSNNNPITFSVSDKDLDTLPVEQRPAYLYEFTSSQFEKNSLDELVVKSPDLDRDAPSQPMLIVQVVAREDLPNGKASAPVSVRVQLRDQNDNPPILQSHPPITIQAGRSRRKIAQMKATDIDEDDSIRFRIIHVSNGGKRTFYVNPTSGEVEVMSRVVAGETYSLTVQATDNNGATSQTILEVDVTPGPNIKPPYFEKLVYDIEVSEGSPRHTSVVTVTARDPEGDTVTYSIVSGNNQQHFTIGESTGVVRVMQPLDREEINRYTLMISAKDEGMKASTATVNIIVTDVNDQNPAFKNLPYSFRVKEGEVGAFVGRVLAEDRDVGRNANISYSVPEEDPFSIEQHTGKIFTKTSLDFETNQVLRVVVTARDGGEVPRLATATATVLVNDVSDELPYFPQTEYEASVPENEADLVVSRVEAMDRDTMPLITYRIMQGDVTKFMIDPQSGEIKTVSGLDYERSKQHVLVVGTEQAMIAGSSTNSSTATVTISVTDVNDIPPSFSRLPPGNTIQVRNDAPLNQIVGRVQATDGDALAPGNQVRYQLDAEQSSERAETYFRVEQESGDIVLQGDLTNELYDEYRLAVRAYDLGEPSLESLVNLRVLVQQVVTLPPNTGLGFQELQHAVQVMENTPQEAVLKTIRLSNKPQRNIRIQCDVTEAFDRDGKDSKSLFKGQLNNNKDCQLILARSSLDHETMDSYRITLTLNTLSAFSNPSKSVASVNVTILDQNDNSPVFLYESDYNKMIGNDYLVTIPQSSQLEEEIFRVAAVDADSGEFGEIKYGISPKTETQTRSFFRVHPETGSVSVGKSLEDVDDDMLPFRNCSIISLHKLIISARDNPNQQDASRVTTAELIINLLTDGNLLVLTVKNADPEEVEAKAGGLTEIMRDRTGLVVDIHQVVPALEITDNGTCCEESLTATDVWFYAIDPNTQKLLDVNTSKVEKLILNKTPQTNLRYTITGVLHVQASEIKAPHQEAFYYPSTSPTSTSVKSLSENQYAGYPAFLIAVGCFVFALSFAAIIYLVILYMRYRHAKDRAQRMVVIPRYEPVFVEPNHKEYEVQVLQMSVNMDDVDHAKMDFSRQQRFDPGFNLDSVSYITHDTSISTRTSPNSDQHLPPQSTFRAATVTGRPVVRNLSSRIRQQLEQDKSSDSDSDGMANPTFVPDSGVLRGYNITTSTPRRVSSFKSPIDATTQL